MALSLVVDSLESVDEAARGFYQQDSSGKYRLSVDGVEDVSGLKGALEKERKFREDAEKRARELAKQYDGVDPNKYRELTAREQEQAEKGLIAAGDVEKLKAHYAGEKEQAVQGYKQQLSEAHRLIQERDAKIRELVVNRSIQDWGVANDVRAEALPDFVELMARNVEIDAEGNLAVRNSTFSLDEFLARQREDRPFYFKPSRASGSGAQQAGLAGGSPGNRKRSEMTDAERVAFITKHGQAAYLALPFN